MLERKIGVSIISFFPQFFVPGGHETIRRILDGLAIQLLPLRGLRRHDVERYKVLSFEGPWNCGTLFSALKRTVGIKGDHPSLVDICFFGSEQLCKRRIRMIASLHRQALPIDVPWVAGSAIELSPDMYQGNARNWDKAPNGVVLDTHHWERFSGSEAEKRYMELGGPAALRMVHLKLMSLRETLLFMTGNDRNSSLLQEFLAHDKAGEIPVVIEAKHNALAVPGHEPSGLLKRLADQINNVLA